MGVMRLLHPAERSIFLFAVLALLQASPAQAANAATVSEKNDDYFVIKGGIYYPSGRLELNDFTDNATRSRLERKNGFTGEIAVGHYFAPLFGIELGAGYFVSKASPGLEPGETTLGVVPIRLSGKLFLPLGPVEPYGELGIGAYVTKLEVSGNLGDFRGATKITYGLHGGVGINVYFTESFFIGLEGRYIQAKPEYGGQPVRLKGFTATIDVGFRY